MKSSQKNKIKTLFKKIIANILVIAISLGFNSPVLFSSAKTLIVESNRLGSAAFVSYSSESYSVIVKSNSAAESYSSCSIKVKPIVDSKPVLKIDLQPNVFENTENNFAQRALELNPKLDAGCINLSVGKISTLNKLVVKESSITKVITVKTGQGIASYNLKQGDEDQVVFANSQNNSLTAVKKQWVSKVLFKQVFVQQINEVTPANGFDKFEILRC